MPLTFDSNSLALALSTLCGRAYSQVFMDLRVSENVAKCIATFTNAVTQFAHIDGPRNRLRRRGCVLNFSGGFDSLAALELMPENRYLVSLDLGGQFEKEREVFSKFEPIEIRTNIVEAGFNRNSWSFMGIGSILSAAVTGAEFMTFGGILEASPKGIQRVPESTRASTFPPFLGAGFTNAAFVSGLTEVATAKIAVQSFPEIVSDSLESLALPGSEKLYRKWLLASLAAEATGTKIDLPTPSFPNSPVRFGSRFTTDFLSLYIRKFAGTELRDRLIKDTPEEIDRLAQTLSLDFYGKLNTTHLYNFPKTLRGGLLERCAQLNTNVFDENDWIEFNAVRESLSKFYPEVVS